MTALSRTALMSGAIDARHASPVPRPIEILQIDEGAEEDPLADLQDLDRAGRG